MADFRIDHREDFFGSNGKSPLILTGQSTISPLIEIVSGARKNMPMANRHKLADQDVMKLKTWIDSGAEWIVKTDVKK